MSAVYSAHFGLHEAPFSISPDPRFVCMSGRFREALAHLQYGLNEAGGFVQLTGEVGTGKTTVCRTLLKELPRNVDVALIFNPKLSVSELLQTLCEELHIPLLEAAPSNKHLLDRLRWYLLQANGEGRQTVLIIDEAQNLAPDVLEQVRLLTNLETDSNKLLQIFLIGQPELRMMLARPELRQVAQRITARFHIGALNLAETRLYIAHRLQVAGVPENASEALFTAGATRAVQRASKGIPRLINIICDRALLGAYAGGLAQVSGPIVRRAAREVKGTTREMSDWLAPAMAGLAGFALLGTVFALWSDGRDPDSSAAAAVTQSSSPPPGEAARKALATTATGTGAEPARGPVVSNDAGESRTVVAAATQPRATLAQRASTPLPPDVAVGAGTVSRTTPPGEAVRAAAPNAATAGNGVSHRTGQVAASQAAESALSGPPGSAAASGQQGASTLGSSAATELATELSRHVRLADDQPRLPGNAAAPPTGATASPSPNARSTQLAALAPGPAAPDSGSIQAADQSLDAAARRGATPTGGGLEAAEATLARLWQLERRAGESLCDAATRAALRCVAGSADTARLARLNRPALLALREPGGSLTYAALTGLDSESAEIIGNGERRRIPLTALELAWNGRFTLLTPASLGSAALLRPGRSSSDVPVLRATLARLAGKSASDDTSRRFDDLLTEAVRNFQRVEGIPVDGVVGPNTRQRLALAAATAGPSLTLR